MAFPEGHLEKVCFRDGIMCPRLAIFVDGKKKTRRYVCMKGREDESNDLIRATFSHDPELVHAITDGAPKGNCSGTPAYFEYPPEN